MLRPRLIISMWNEQPDQVCSRPGLDVQLALTIFMILLLWNTVIEEEFCLSKEENHYH